MKKTVKVAIATSSKEKINGIKNAFFQFFENEDIEFFMCSTRSGVMEQPFGDETYQGVLNRGNGAKKIFSRMDYYVSCEAGIECALNQYFNVQVVCIFDNNAQRFFWGKSAGWQIPSKDIEKIRTNNLDKYLREKGINNIEELLGPSNSRRMAVEQATELALASARLI